VKNVKKLFNFDFISLLLKTFEMIASEREKGKIEFDLILCEASRVFSNFSLEGSNMPDSNNENSLFQTFQEINTIERLNNLFIRFKQLNSPSEKLKKCLNNLALAVCRFFSGRTPLVLSGPVLEYCDEMRKLPSPSEGFDYVENASISWDNMVNPETVLAEWKKK
jgi:hypothetical protein